MNKYFWSHLKDTLFTMIAGLVQIFYVLFLKLVFEDGFLVAFGFHQ